MLKSFLVVLVIALTSLASYRFAVVPYNVNVRQKLIDRDLAEIYSRHQRSKSTYADKVTLRRHAQTLSEWLRIMETDASLHMELAWTYMLLGRVDEAIATFESSLRFHRRSELFRGLADAQISAGRAEDAIDGYARAVAFYPANILLVPESLRHEVRQRIVTLYGVDAGA
jgi:tetratricopeptide (TPR) repeat protein